MATENIFVDAQGTPIGRVGSYVAKQALQGAKVFILNSEKAIITGNKENTIVKWKERRAKGGSALKGPFHSKDSEKILKRAIRGMLPNYRLGRGRDAWKRIKCYIGIPAEYKEEKLVQLKTKTSAKHIGLEELKRKL